ncbi:hypothetical protein DICVIV_04565 [Dictyocaulus viviparus]|uniref:Cadherin domain-containing protein n=1 Tax=Dictyocaulus viviparus TaxID=29172 RepID=A0A0D8Y414_DICVI|nr:hypothetical protein DICVIV_04565 [Dictyocaulus viviparus]
MEFNEPSEQLGPVFDQTSYRAQIFSGSWPQPGYPFAVISAHSSDSSNLTYSLYSPNNEKNFSVDANTGELFLTSRVPSGEEFCTLLVAKDHKGRMASVPVAINTGGLRRECGIFDITGLTPSIYHGPHRGSLGSWTTMAPTTSVTEGIHSTEVQISDSSTKLPSSATIETTFKEYSTSQKLSTVSGSMNVTTGHVSSPIPSPVSSETPTTGISSQILSTTAEISSLSSFTPLTNASTTTKQTNEPIHPIPISPDATPATLPYSGATTIETIESTEYVVTITPDSHPPPLTFSTATETYPSTSPVSMISSATSRATYATDEMIITITPDTSLQTLSSETIAGSDTTTEFAPITLTESIGSIKTSDFSTSLSPSAEDTSDVTTISNSSPEIITTSEITYTETLGKTTKNVLPTVFPPQTLPTSITSSPFITTLKSTKTTLNPYYGVACLKKGEPIWDLICELSKASIRKNS